jgi:5-oxoprolinase (ATP-hydrolysing) subunit A
MQRIDLNCDMGESNSLWPYSLEKDLQLLKFISSMNLACGYHAGDAHTMHQLIDAALEHNVAIGAHPGFDDKENFGRTNQVLSPVKLYDIVLYQLGALNAFLQVRKTNLHHVKPHGALYNMAATNRIMADTICRAVMDFDSGLILYGLSGSELINAADAIGLRSCNEVFADRTYQPNGTLTPREQANALIENTAQSLKQVLQMVMEGTATDITGNHIALKSETICIHGDGKHAVNFADIIKETLKQHHVLIQFP